MYVFMYSCEYPIFAEIWEAQFVWIHIFFHKIKGQVRINLFYLLILNSLFSVSVSNIEL